jgi:hypothetical protein
LYFSDKQTKDRLKSLAASNVDVDAKINTLESEGKCSPSSGKSTKYASQFDL